MAQPYVGEIRMVAFNFAPTGWAACDGSLLPILANQTLFTVIGTTYGGDGQSTFAVPDLRGRIPIHLGTQTGIAMGAHGGSESVVLTAAQIPAHGHALMAAQAAGASNNPAGNLLAQPGTMDLYSALSQNTSLSSLAVLPAGGGQSHDNMQPFLCVNFIISLLGIYPSP